MIRCRLSGENQTMEFAARLARLMQPGTIVLLEGPLGAGKTTFVRGLAKGLELSEDYDIVSPTFTLLNIYPARIPLYHADCYRVGALAMLDLDIIGQAGDGVLAVEWPGRDDVWPKDTCWCVVLDYDGAESRSLVLHAPPALRNKVTACFSGAFCE